MAVEPLPIQRRYDMQSLSEAVRRICGVLNLGGIAIDSQEQRFQKVPPRYTIYPLRVLCTTYGLLPSPNGAGAGARAMITDSVLAHHTNSGTVVEGGGSETVPVYSDGTNWLIG